MSGATLRRFRRGALGLALLGVGTACGPAPETSPLPNLVIVTLDTTRADHLGLYGYHRNTSPALDALGAESLVFERAIAPMATTLPTHVSLLTATSPLEHGVLANTTQGGERFVPSRGLRSFAEICREAGYATGAFVSAAPLKRGSGIEAGFERFDEPAERQRRGDATLDRAVDWLADARRPFLLWVHTYDAHWPYEPPPPFDAAFATDARLEAWMAERGIPDQGYRPLVRQAEDTRAALNAYDGELRFQDAQLGRLLSALRRRPDWPATAVLVVGDHGEGLSQHGHPAHGGTWNEQLRVPLVIRVPGVAPRRIAALVSVSDAIPTLIGQLSVPALGALLPQASGRDALAADFVETAVLSQDTGRESRQQPRRFSLTAPRYKYFRAGDGGDGAREELYDLVADPFELHDIAPAEPAATAALRQALLEEIERHRARGRELRGGAATTTQPTDPEILQQLRELGYLDTEPGDGTR